MRKSSSWHGSWPRFVKSAASTPEVAKESILGDTSLPNASPNLSLFEKKRDAGAMVGNNAAEVPSTDAAESQPCGQPEPAEHNPIKCSDGDSKSSAGNGPEVHTVNKAQPASSGWLGWFGKSAPNPQGVSDTNRDTAPDEAPKEGAPAAAAEIDAMVSETEEDAKPASTELEGPPVDAPSARKSSWLPFWPGSPSKRVSMPETPPPLDMLQPSHPNTSTVEGEEDNVTEDAPAPISRPEPSPSAGSTWAFWSRETKLKSNDKYHSACEAGELAVVGEGSEVHPKPAKTVEVKEPLLVQDIPPQKTAPKKKQGTPTECIDVNETTPTCQTQTSAEATASQKASMSKSPNLLLPSFNSTYQTKENPSVLRQIVNWLLLRKQPLPNQIFRSREAPKLKKALAIGVHGLFPAAYLRPMIGQPTGTSIKFANHGAEAIRRWAETHDCPDVEIEKVALEGEGKIAERVGNLWKLLLNWIELIRNADLVMVCCHSQGVPVSVMLVDKLIDLGIVTSARIGICAMAGVSLGPFSHLKPGMGILMGSAAELWQFSNQESEVAKRYEHALKQIVEYGVRITFVGSIDDQLVPIDSAVYSPVNHPYICRAVFIDGRVHAPDFIVHLVGFALKLRNLGVSDHGLLRELSVPLAGSLYGGEGHSRLYDEEQVYE